MAMTVHYTVLKGLETNMKANIKIYNKNLYRKYMLVYSISTFEAYQNEKKLKSRAKYRFSIKPIIYKFRPKFSLYFIKFSIKHYSTVKLLTLTHMTSNRK